MLLQNILIISTLFTFESIIKYLFICAYCFYFLYDKAVDWIINSPSSSFTSSKVEYVEESEYSFRLNYYWDCLNACNENAIIRYFRICKYVYCTMKTIVYPLEFTYKQFEKIYIPQMVNRLDEYYKACLFTIGLFIYKLRISQYFVNKAISILQRNMFNMLLVYSKINKSLSSKDLKQIKKLNNPDNIDMKQLDSVIKMLQKNPEFIKTMDTFVKTINVDTINISNDDLKLE